MIGAGLGGGREKQTRLRAPINCAGSAVRCFERQRVARFFLPHHSEKLTLIRITLNWGRDARRTEFKKKEGKKGGICGRILKDFMTIISNHVWLSKIIGVTSTVSGLQPAKLHLMGIICAYCTCSNLIFVEFFEKWEERRVVIDANCASPAGPLPPPPRSLCLTDREKLLPR